MLKNNQKGYSLVELLIAAAILATVTSMVLMARTFVAKQTVRTTDRAYASQKAVQMFEELRALVGGSESDISVLDDYSDGTKFNKVLTTDRTVDLPEPAVGNPGDPLSGNRLFNGYWKFLRQIQVQKVANDSYVRQVTVKVYRFASDANPDQPGELLVTVGGMLRTIATIKAPTQVLDVYILAVNNVSGWWAVLPRLSNTMASVLQDIQDRNSGLELRSHYITRNAFGRDSMYIPFINNTYGTGVSLVMPWIYLYPGMVPEQAPPNGSGTNTAFYDPSSNGVRTTGNFNVDGGKYSPSLFSGCPGFAVADQFNTGMRYPDEESVYQAVSQAAAASNNIIPEISWRMLMEGMLSSPASFTNAIIVNLHGEMLPIPPMRNYSDAAKSPAASPNMRVVTHPELIYYPAAVTASVTFRVYSYYDGMENPSTLPSGDPRVPAISLYLPDVNLNFSSVTITGIVGSGTVSYAAMILSAATSLTPGTTVNGMSCSIANNLESGGVTGSLLVLYGSPLRCPSGPPTASGPVSAGLRDSDRLYCLEYIPCSPDKTIFPAPYTFTSRPLTYIGTGPKNTARWIISAGGVSVGTHPVETRIGDAVTYNSVYSNSSRTYVWVGNNNPPPYTERYQFIGDPRHCPYLDVKVGGLTGGAATIQANGYNWYFKRQDGTFDGYSGFGQSGSVTGWGADQSNVDIPRYYQMIREGLLNTTSIWATTNGWSFYYWGIGGEFGFDHPPYSGSITFQQGPWTTSGDAVSLTRVDEIIDSGTTNRARVVAGIDNSGTTSQWYAKSWLGELYPDSFYSTWVTIGNLPTRQNTNTFTSSLKFYRATYSSIATSGNSLNGFGRDIRKRTQGQGCTSFFDGVNSGNYYEHFPNDAATGSRLDLAATCYGIFQYPIPPLVNASRPWAMANSGTPGYVSEWSISPYNSIRTSLSIPQVNSTERLYFDSSLSNRNASGVVQVEQGGRRAYVLATGTSPSADVGVAELAKTVLIFSLRTFLDGGQMAVTGATGHITQLPLVKLYLVNETPRKIYPVPQFSEPSAVTVMAASPLLTADSSAPLTNVWYRYAGGTAASANFYTEEYPGASGPLTASSYVEPVTLIYNLKYSPDKGTSWYFMQDNNSAETGVPDFSMAHAVTNAMPVTNVEYTWDVSNTTQFPQGEYRLLVEVYRSGFPLHYSYHYLDITINR